MPEENEGNNYKSKINAFPVTRFFFYQGVKKWICLPHTEQ